MAHSLLVMKFGGSNMQDAAAIAHSASLAARWIREGSRVVVVVSAMAGITNQLLATADMAERGDISGANDALAEMRTRHMQAAQELGGRPDSATVRELRELLETLRQVIYGVYLLRELSPRSRDLIVSFGERLSSPLMALALEGLGITAAHLTGGAAGIVTDSHFGGARPLPQSSERIRSRLGELLEEGIAPVVAGFMGETPRGSVTTLGRGGTDYSATIIAEALRATEVWAWKDVDGVMTADPRVVPDARNIEVLSYGEVMELAYFGAKVLHPLAVTPLQESGIPLRVKSAADPDFAGTLVQRDSQAGSSPAKAVTAIRGVSIITISGAGVLGVPATLASVFSAITRENITLLMIAQSSSMSNVSLALPAADVSRAMDALAAVGDPDLSYEEVGNMAVLAIVGAGLRGAIGVSAKMFGALAEAGVNIRMISQGSSELNVSVALEEAQVDEATRAVHAAFGLGRHVDG